MVDLLPENADVGIDYPIQVETASASYLTALWLTLLCILAGSGFVATGAKFRKRAVNFFD